MRTCASIAKSSQAPCRNRAVPSSRYCVWHIDKRLILAGAMAGVVVGYPLSWILPSPETVELKALRSDVRPLLSLAETSFPSLDRKAAVAALSGEVDDLRGRVTSLQTDLGVARDSVRELEAKADASARGITSAYDFNGDIRQTSPGKVTLHSGGKSAQFAMIVDLHNKHRWHDLLAACETEMSATPDWLTPYMFAGVANANLGDVDEAQRLWSHVQQKAAGDPAYAAVDELLSKLGAR